VTLFTRYLFAADLLLMFPARSHVLFTLMHLTKGLSALCVFIGVIENAWLFLLQPQTEKTCQVSFVSKY